MTELQRGDIFEQKFRIDAVIGEGGFAVVYEATDLKLQRRVAIKVIRTDTDSAEMTSARFQREIRALGQLQDPHTVRLYENGVTVGDLHPREVRPRKSAPARLSVPRLWTRAPTPRARHVRPPR